MRKGSASVVAMALVVTACGSSTPSAGTSLSAATSVASVPLSSPAVTEAPKPSTAFAGLTLCTHQPPVGSEHWLCGTIAVPLDRADATAGSLRIAFYVLPHTDLTTPAGLPLFATPGGPGGPGFDNYILYAMQPTLRAHHDIVTMDPRGTGQSAPINCPALQAGATNDAAAVAAAAACGQHLGTSSGRYGSADRAMDLEEIRTALGFPKIDYFGGSYGGVDVQAYAARFREHLHAIVLDSSFPVTDAAHLYWTGGSFGAPALVHVPALQCSRDDLCKQIAPDAEAVLRDMVAAIRKHPLTGNPSGATAPISLDEVALEELLYDASPVELFGAATAFEKGNPQLLLDLSARFPAFPVTNPPDPIDAFSEGANLAGYCNDVNVAWDRNDPLATRRSKYASYLASLPDDAFAPFSKAAWATYNIMDFCLEWPAPVDFAPVIPDGATLPAVPALILAGDEDHNVAAGITKSLLAQFPKASFVEVAGVGHGTVNKRGPCVPSIIAGFLETTTLPDTSCAGTPG